MRAYESLKTRFEGIRIIGGGLAARLINSVECARMGEVWTGYERAKIINRYIAAGFKQFCSGIRYRRD